MQALIKAKAKKQKTKDQQPPQINKHDPLIQTLAKSVNKKHLTYCIKVELQSKTQVSNGFIIVVDFSGN